MMAMCFAVTPTIQTREEALVEKIAATVDPMERHFMMLEETERKEKARQQLQYWE
jgi:hypothetical protein